MAERGAREVAGAFLRLGLTSFGGPVAHLGYFREEFVARRRWIGEREYAELVAICQFLPGPTSSQVGFALGLRRGGYRGALAAWAAFTLPSALLLVLFACGAFALEGPVGGGLLVGLKAVAVAVVAHAVWSMARTLTPDIRRALIGMAAAASALLLPGSLGQLAAIALGLLAGLVLCRPPAPQGAGAPSDTEPDPVSEPAPGALARVSRRVGIASLALLALILVALPIAASVSHNLWVSAADAFTRAGALVFGGGHVALPLLQAEPAIAEAVSPDSFLAGYAAVQAVPGPLFSLAAYLGFEMGIPAGVPEAILLASITLIAVFLPGMLALLAALPFWGAIRERPAARAAIAGANAAVVGVLAAALCTPIIPSAIVGPAPLVIALGCLLLLALRRIPVWAVVAAGAAAGSAAALLGLGSAW